MQNWMLELINQYGYLGIMFLIAIENVFPPIPSEAILTFGGFMTTFTSLEVVGVIIAATFGSLIGAIILYGVGYYLSPEHLGRLLDGKLGKVIQLTREDFKNTCEKFNQKGKGSVLICRCIPIIRSLISVPAGMAQMKLSLFLLFTAIGSLIWNTLLVCLGALLGSSWEKIVEKTGVFSQIIYWGLILGITLFGLKLVKRSVASANKE